MRRVEVDDDFEEYVVARWPRLVGAAVMLGCSPADAEDLVQTALVRCYRSLHRVREAGDRDAYVHRVLINTYRSSRRRRWHGEHPVAEMRAEAGDGGDVGDLAHVEVRHTLDQALHRLPLAQRAVVVLRFYAHLDQQQTAAALDVPVGTVKSRLSRALAALAQDSSLTELRGLS